MYIGDVEMKRVFLLTAVIISLVIGSSQTYAAGQYYSGILGVKSNSRIAVNGIILDMERAPVSINGRLVVPARTVFSKIDVNVNWNAVKNRLIMTKGNKEITMYIGYTNCYVNGDIKAMEAPAVLFNGTVMVPVRFVAETFNMSVGWNEANSLAYIGSMPEGVSADGSNSSKVKNRVVVVDAGHGGNQTGALYGGVKEKNLNLDIAKILNNKLKELGIVTYMTRNDDSSFSLYSRSALANMKNADLLISIHNNAGLKRYTGSMSLYYPSSSKTKGNLSSYEFASIVQKNMCAVLGSNNMGIIPRSELAVLRTANMPAVIAEVGYMSNSSELSKLKTYAYKEKAADSLKKAIVESLERMY